LKIQVSATTKSPTEFQNLKAFLRADDNLETKYDLRKQEERYAAGDLNLWKVLLPIVRVRGHLPSEEFQNILPVEPSTTLFDIRSKTIRPAPIPGVVQSKVKNWYVNRVSMAADITKVP
jgi:hypothetical protein